MKRAKALHAGSTCALAGGVGFSRFGDGAPAGRMRSRHFSVFCFKKDLNALDAEAPTSEG